MQDWRDAVIMGELERVLDNIPLIPLGTQLTPTAAPPLTQVDEAALRSF